MVENAKPVIMADAERADTVNTEKEDEKMDRAVENIRAKESKMKRTVTGSSVKVDSWNAENERRFSYGRKCHPF